MSTYKPPLPVIPKETKTRGMACNCGHHRWVQYGSLNLLQCGECLAKYKWERKEGQPPLMANNRMIHT